MDMNRIAAEIEACTPEKGFTVVEVDRWSVPGEGDSLRALKDFDTRAEAQAYIDSALESEPNAKLYIYAAPGEKNETEGYED